MSSKDLEPRARRSDAISVVIVVAHMAFTYAPVVLAAALGPSVWLLAFWLWFGLCKNGVINLMHECAHKLTFRRVWANEFLGRYVLAPLVLTDFESYRERHWEHHRHLGSARDPKLVYQTDIRGSRFAQLLGRCLVGVEAIRRLTERPADTSGGAGAKHASGLLRLVAAQSVLMASIAAVSFVSHDDLLMSILAAGLAYGFVYAYGLGSITIFAAALRAIAEHQIGEQPGKTQERAALRNLRCNPFTRLLFGAYGFGEHATHHAEPDVPYYHLPARTADLARGDAQMEIGSGYLQTLSRFVMAPRPTSDPAIRGAE